MNHALADLMRLSALDSGNVIRVRPNGFLACIEFRGRDVLGADDHTLSAYEDAIVQILNGRSNEWGYHITVQRGNQALYPETGAWPSPMVFALDKARMVFYESEGEHRPTTHRLWISYYPNAVNRRILAELSGDASLRDEKPRETFEQTLVNIEGAMQLRAYDVKRLGLEIVSVGRKLVTTSTLVNALAEELTWRDRIYAIDPNEPLFVESLVLPDRFLADPLVIDNHPHVVASVYGYPNHGVESAHLSGFSRLPYRLKVVSRIIPLTRSQAHKSLDKRSRAFLLSSLDLSLFFQKGRHHGEGNESALAMRDTIAHAKDRVDDNTPWALQSHTIVIRADSQAQVPAIHAALDRLADELKIKISIERGKQAFNAWLGAVPGELDRNVRRRSSVSLRAAVRNSPFTSTWHGPKTHSHKRYPSKEPILRLSTPSKEPFSFSHHFGEVGHTMIFGATGSGKSVLLRALENAHLSRYEGSFALVADIGYSAFAYAKMIGAPHLTASRSAGPQFAVLKGLSDPQQFPDICDWVIDLYETWTGQQASPAIVQSMATGLKTLAEDDPNEIRLSSLSNLVPDQDLRSFFAEFKGTFFDAKADGLDFTQAAMRYWCVEYGSLGIDNVRWVSPFIGYIQRLAYASFEKLTAAPRLIVIDEAARALRSRRVADFAERMEREGRKHLTSAILATQTPLEIINSPIARALIDQTVTLVTFGNPQAIEPETAKSYREVGFTREQLPLIASLQPFEFLISTREGTQICTLRPTPPELAIYAGASEENTANIRAMEEEHGPAWRLPYLQSRCADIPGLRDYLGPIEEILEQSMSSLTTPTKEVSYA